MSGPPPLPEVEETVGLTAAGQVQDFSRFADGLVQSRPRPPVRRPGMWLTLVVLALVVVGAALYAGVG